MINAYPQPTNTAPTFPPAETPSATPQAPQKKGLFSSFTKKTWYLIGGLVALIILVGGSSAGLYLAQINSENRPAAGLSCPGGTCPDGWSYGPDTDAPQSSCAQRAIDACVGHGGSSGTPTGGSNTCDSSQTTAAACRGKNVGDHVAGTCTCFRTTGTLCGCRADTAPPSPSATASRTCANAGGTEISSGPNTGKCQCNDADRTVVSQSERCPVDKGPGGTKTPTCATEGGTCQRGVCGAGSTQVTNVACSGAEQICCKPNTNTARTCSQIGGVCSRGSCAGGASPLGGGSCTGEGICCPATVGGSGSTNTFACCTRANTTVYVKDLAACTVISGNSGVCPNPQGAKTCADLGATEAPQNGPNVGKCICPDGFAITHSQTCKGHTIPKETAKACSTLGGTCLRGSCGTGRTQLTNGVCTGEGICCSAAQTVPGGSTGGTTGGTGTGTGGTGTGTGSGGTSTTGAMCPNASTTPIKKYVKFTCPNGCTVTTEGGVTAARCYENRVESTSPLTLGANECGQVDALSGDSDSTYCGYTQYRCDGSCGGGGNPSPSPKTPEYSCNSLCTTNAQCRGENDQLRCVTVANGSKRCRLNGNEASTKCQPAVGPQCLAIRLRKADGITPIKFGENDPKLGESVTLLCGKVDAAARYIFRVVDPDGDRTRLESTGQVSAPFKIEKAGKYTAQCQICTGDSNDTCLPFESLND